MEANVKKRFFRKPEALGDRLTFIEDHFAPIDGFEENRLLRKALYKEDQRLACMRMAA
uniref:Uncharacterized protein n=1 Tax=Candidatus Methanogaster sp. ANME-2c ERB4 TaxID=2759911 RepID=A0A7G9XZT9_9EURY|nr:hypothetical protein BHHPIBDN_00003 [Methanosarcinales archaeon ANME-2c ERB4]